MISIISKIANKFKKCISLSFVMKKYSQNQLYNFIFLFTNIHHGNFFNLKLLISFNDVHFLIRQSDWFAFEEIILNKEYKIVNNVIDDLKNPVIVDIGANIGLFSLYLFSLNPNCSIVSIEPSIKTFRIMNKNKLLNNFAHWSIVNKALWHTNGFVNFQSTGPSTCHHVSSNSNFDKVSCITLKDIISNYTQYKYIDLLKIDIEGSEQYALDCFSELYIYINNLLIEMHPDLFNTDNLLNLLTSSFPHSYIMINRNSRKPIFLFSRTIAQLQSSSFERYYHNEHIVGDSKG